MTFSAHQYSYNKNIRPKNAKLGKKGVKCINISGYKLYSVFVTVKTDQLMHVVFSFKLTS